MTDNREETLSNFRARFIATIGTAGSKEGILLLDAVNNFQKDWNEPVQKYVVALGYRTITELLNNFQDIVSVRHGRVYPVVTTNNEHVFSLIDRTKRKSEKKKLFYAKNVDKKALPTQAEDVNSQISINATSPPPKTKKSKPIKTKKSSPPETKISPPSKTKKPKKKRRGKRTKVAQKAAVNGYGGNFSGNAQANTLSVAFWDSNASKQTGSAFYSAFSHNSNGVANGAPISISHGFGAQRNAKISVNFFGFGGQSTSHCGVSSLKINGSEHFIENILQSFPRLVPAIAPRLKRAAQRARKAAK